LHWAAINGQLDILLKICVTAKFSLTTEEIKNCYSPQNEGNTAWNREAEGGELETLQKMWGWGCKCSSNIGDIK
jgi:hypothetical protein